MADPTDSANQLSNWGRWGTEDQKGALNLITPELIKRATGLVYTSAVYSLAMPLEAEGPQWPPRHKTWKTTQYGNLSGKGSADDIVTMHSHSGTHIDTLCHVWYEDQLHNGFDVNKHISFGRGDTQRDRKLTGYCRPWRIAGYRRLERGPTS